MAAALALRQSVVRDYAHLEQRYWLARDSEHAYLLWCADLRLIAIRYQSHLSKSWTQPRVERSFHIEVRGRQAAFAGMHES